MKKFLAGLIAVLCVFSSINHTFASSKISNGISFNAIAASTDDVSVGKFADSYKYEFADSSIYSTKFSKLSLSAIKDGKKVDISTWTADNGNVYGIYTVAVTEIATKTIVSSENVIALVTANETTLDVNMSENVFIPESVQAVLDEKGISISDSRATCLCDSSFAGSYLKSIDLSGIKYIGNKAFQKCSFITDIIIPDSVVYVGDYAFDNSGLKTLSVQCEMPVIPKYFCSATKLTKIEFAYPQYIKTVGESAFSAAPVAAPFFMSDYYSGSTNYEFLTIDKSAFKDCTSIKEITMPDNLVSIGEKGFADCTSLTSLKCGKNLLGMDKDSFSGCTSLDTIVFNDGLICIGGGSFQGCTSLKEVKDIPSSLNDWEETDPKTHAGIGLGDGVFANCTSLELCELPISLTKIPDKTFLGCKKLTTVIGDFNKNGDKLLSIGSSAFENCISISEAKYKNVTSIGEKAFSSCTGLTIADFPSVVYIGVGKNNKGASFLGCTALKKVNIPVVKYIYEQAFKGCSAMTEFTAGECELVGNNALDSCTSMTEITLLSNLYGNATPTSKNTTDGFVFQNCSNATKIKIKSEYMTKTPNGLFNGCSSLRTIDGDLTNIAIVSPKTFAGCTALEELDLPAVRILESNAFADCSTIKKISNSSNALNAEDYGDNAFLNCSELKIEIGGTISTIGASSFKNSGITKVNIEGMQGGTVVIGNNAFSDCANLTEAKILSDSAAKFSIGSSVFANCPNLKKATYDGKIVTASMFKNCPLLKNVSTNATTIKANAFEGDVALILLENMADPGNSIIADEVNSAAFKDCTALNTLPADSHTNIIGSSNFANCSSLKSVEVGTLTQSIFSGCSSLSDVSLSNITTIPTSAFEGCTELSNIDFTNITSVGQKAFSNSGLTQVKISNAQVIEGSAFASCAALLTAEVSANTIGTNAFSKCISLTDATISTNKIGGSAFIDCSELKNVELVSDDIHTLNEIGTSAFSNCKSLKSLTINSNPTMLSKCVGYINNKVDSNFTLVGNSDSTVQKYATNNNIKFVNINGYTPPVSKVTLLGDANCDNKVTVADAVAILQSIANKDRYALTEEGTANADCYDPGSGVTAKDAYTIQKLDAKVIPSLPEAAE